MASGLFILGTAAVVSWLTLYEQDTPGVEAIQDVVVGEEEATAAEMPPGAVDAAAAKATLDVPGASDANVAPEVVGASNVTVPGVEDESPNRDTLQQVDSNGLESSDE